VVFGAGNLLRHSILNVPKAIKLLADAFTIIKPLIKNELPLAVLFNAPIEKIKFLAHVGYGLRRQRCDV